MIVAGERFGRLTTVAVVGRSADRHKIWRCKCDCGAEADRTTNNLRAKALVSCGCAQSDLQRKHGGKGTPTYESWVAAIQRCHNSNSKDFRRYGARGISVCQRWRDSFEQFRRDMGERPPGKTLDRWPNQNGDYEPGNCRWATTTEQARNRRSSIYVDWRGASTHLSDVAAEIGITYGAAFMRLKRGKLHAVL